LLKKYKHKTTADSEQTEKDFRGFFRRCLNVDDKWFKKNATLPVINSKINEYKVLIAGQNRDRKARIKEQKETEERKALEANLIEVFGKEIKEIGGSMAMPKREFNKLPEKIMTRVEYLRRYGYGRLNDYEGYKKRITGELK